MKRVESMPAYYNEIEPYAAQWLRNLIAAGHIAPGDVDERSITEVQPDDLRGYEQCHFFAGIGGWSYALRLAGWPDSRPVWTGSCPCQPFSAAGKQRGSDDERHLWPAFFDLIRERRPASVFGEQVAGAAGLAWLDHVCADLEDAGYAAAAANLGAHSVGAPHIRQRLYWVAHAADVRSCCAQVGRGVGAEQGERRLLEFARTCDTCSRFFERYKCNAPDECDCPRCQGYCSCSVDQLDHAQRPRLEGHGADQAESGWHGAAGSTPAAGVPDPWDDLEWINCSDGKARPTQSGLFPLVDGVSNRVGRLRAYGNAIVPQVAAAFVMATR